MSVLTINLSSPESSLLVPASRPRKERRSVYEITRLLLKWSENSPYFFSAPLDGFEIDQQAYHLPRFVFIGPPGGGDYFRVAVFAGIHGDEIAGPFGAVEFVRNLLAEPERARGYEIYLYPVANPTGFEDGTRFSRSGKDLNREFWKQSREPEVSLLEHQLRGLNFNGLISLHADDTSSGIYGYARGATLSSEVLEPALQAAEVVLPRNFDKSIDNFRANRGIIRQGYEGMLSAPPRSRPRPFEIVFETPQTAPMDLQVRATVVALETIFSQYRTLLAVAQNI